MRKNLAGLAIVVSLMLALPVGAQELRPELPVPPEDQAAEAEEQKAVDKVTDAVLDPAGANKATESPAGAEVPSAKPAKPAGANHAIVTGAAKSVGKGVESVGSGAVKGVEAVGHGAARGVGAVGHGAVKGVEAVGHGAESVGSSTVKGVEAVGHGAEAVGRGAMTGAGAVGSGTVKGVEAVGSGAVRGVEAVGKGARRGVEAVGSGAQTVGRGAIRGAESIGAGAKKGAMSLGRSAKKGFSALKVWDRDGRPEEKAPVPVAPPASQKTPDVDESSAVPSENSGKAVAENTGVTETSESPLDFEPAATVQPAPRVVLPQGQPEAPVPEATGSEESSDERIDTPKSWAD